MRSRDLSRILEQWKEVWSVCGGWHWSWSDSKVCFLCVWLLYSQMSIICDWILEKRSKSHIRSSEINGFKELKPA